jgi:hypothetical protein
MAEIISSYIANLLQIANLFISIFIIILAYLFFQKTKPHKERTPWILLFVAVILFFIFELMGLLITPIPEVRDFFKTLFIAFMLYVFVYQHYLLKDSQNITIQNINNKTKLNVKEIVKETKIKLKKEKANFKA